MFVPVSACKESKTTEHIVIKFYAGDVNTLRTGDADLRLYVTIVQDG